MAAVSLGTLCSDEGTLVLDRGRYGCASSAQATVVDCDLNTNSGTAQTVTIEVWSDSEPAGESVLLTESGPNTSRFVGTVALAVTDAPGVVLVANGETVTARYVDADDGSGGFGVDVTDTALVDCTPPGVLAVSFSDVTGTSARMTVLTDEPVVAEALYGTSCAGTTSTPSSSGSRCSCRGSAGHERATPRRSPRRSAPLAVRRSRCGTRG